MRKQRQEQIRQNIGRGRRAPGSEPPGKRGGKGNRGRGGRGSLTEPLTPKQARKMAGGKARAEYAPVARQVKAELRASGQRQQDIGSWFGQLGEQIGSSAAQTDASYDAANAAMRAQIEAAGKAAAEAQAKVSGSNADFVKLVGADPSAFAQGSQEAASASAQRGLTGAILGAPIAAAGANQAAYLRNLGLNAGREGIYQRGQESKRARQIKQDLMALRKERAQKAQANFGEIRDKEREYGIQRAAFGLDKKEAATAAAQSARDYGLDLREQRERERHNRQTEANSAADNASGGLTPSERRGIKEGRRNAMSAAWALYRSEKPPASPQEWARFQKVLSKEDGVDPAEARYAVTRLKRKLRPKVERKRRRERRKEKEAIPSPTLPGATE